MIKILKFSHDEFVIMTQFQTQCVNQADALDVLEGYGIEESEVLAAFNTMSMKGDNMADFGINGTFLFTYKYEKAA